MRIHVVQDPSFHRDPLLTDLASDPTSPYWQAINTLSNALIVQPLQSNLKIGLRCDDRFTSGNNIRKCISGTVQQVCGIFNVSDELVNYPETCESGNSACTPASPGIGVNADYTLIVGSLDGKREREREGEISYEEIHVL